jgi:heparin binding hemagglutinin HbhA
MVFSAPDPGEERTSAEPPHPAANGAHPRSPWLAVLGAGDAAVTAVARAVTDAFSAASSTASTRQKTMQQRMADLPGELDGLRARFSGDELRRALDAYRAQLERAYAELSGRGEEAWERLRERPQVRQAITALESYTEKLDARVDDAHDAATRALAAAGRQTRATGEKVARTGQRFSGRAADAVVDASAATADAVEDAGTTAAETIEEAGDGAAAATRKATRSSRPATPRKTPRPPGPSSQ